MSPCAQIIRSGGVAGGCDAAAQARPACGPCPEHCQSRRPVQGPAGDARLCTVAGVPVGRGLLERRARPMARMPSSIRVWTVASPMPRLVPETTAVLAVRLRFMTLRLRNGVAWSLAAGCPEPSGCSSGVGTGPPVSWPGARCGRAFSGVDGVPGRLVVLDVDAAEGHVGEVDAEADGVGLGELVDEVAAEAGGLLVVEVEDVLPERVGDLQRGVEGVAEGDHLLPAGADDVGGVPGAVA